MCKQLWVITYLIYHKINTLCLKEGCLRRVAHKVMGLIAKADWQSKATQYEEMNYHWPILFIKH